MKITVNELRFASLKEFADYLIKNHSTRELSEEERQHLIANLQMHDPLLAEITALFTQPPYPNFDQFLSELEKSSRDLRLVMIGFDKDPHAMRNDRYHHLRLVKTSQQIINQQLNTTELKRVLQNTVKETQHLSDKEQYCLGQQVLFINAIAKEYPVTIADKQYKDLTQLPRKTLRQLSDLLISQIRNPANDEQDLLKAQLKLIAVLREQYFRATGIFINSTQLLTVLLGLQPHNMAIATHSPHEKKDTTALIAALRWAMSAGTFIDVCTPDAQPENRQTVKDFFTALGVNSFGITDYNTPSPLGGINYTNLRQLALDQAVDKRPRRCLIVNEPDFSNLDTKQLFYPTHLNPREIDYISTQELFNLYLERGQITVMSDQFADKKALSAQCRKCGVADWYKLPPHDIQHDFAKPHLMPTKQQAIAKHYDQLVLDKQRVILQHFAEWHALLKLVYPPAAWQELDKELKELHSSLKKSLEELWSLSLKSIPLHNVPSQFLDDAVKGYELKIAATWQSAQRHLEAHVEKYLPANSVNTLRYKYLKAISVAELLQLNKIETRLLNKENSKKQKKSNFYMHASFDIDGAMLQYGDGDLTSYKTNFSAKQRQLMTNDVIDAVNHSSLSKDIKEVLRNRVALTTNFLGLELILLDVQHWLGSQKSSEKYRWQPIILHLLKIYKQARLVESSELKQLKRFYLENVIAELTYSLKTKLSWSVLKTPSYWLERSAVTGAAAKISQAAAELDDAKTMTARRTALRALYKELVTQQALLADLWIFSLGHKNTRDLILETLATLDNIKVIDSASPKISADFILECKESAYAAVMKTQAQDIIKKFTKENSWLSKYAQWNSIVKQLNLIAQENNSVYCVDEMYHLLNKKRHELSYNDLKLYKQVVKLRDEMGALSRNNASQQPDLFDQSRHFAFKAQQLMARFKGFAHVTVRKVSIKPLTTGFNHSFDLVIEGEGNHRVFDNFIKYKAPLDELHKDRDALLISIQEAQRNILSLGNVWKNVLPLIKLDTPVNQAKILNEFPQPLHGKIAELFMVIQTARNIEPPADLSTFPEAIHKNFLDRAFLNALDFEQLTPDKINEIKDLSLQNDIRNVFTKLKPPSPEHSLFRRTVNLLLSSFQENEEDLRYQFAVLKTQPNDALRQFFALELSRKTALIGQDLEDLVNAVEDGLTLMKRKLQFIDATIRVEQQNSGVMVKRFASLEQLYEFDDALRVLTKDYVPVVEKEIPKRIAADVAFVDEGVGCGFVFP